MAKKTPYQKAQPIMDSMKRHFDKYPTLNFIMNKEEAKQIIECLESIILERRRLRKEVAKAKEKVSG